MVDTIEVAVTLNTLEGGDGCCGASVAFDIAVPIADKLYKGKLAISGKCSMPWTTKVVLTKE